MLQKRYCSFCEKEQAQVLRMVIGTFGQICDECVVKFYKEMHIPSSPTPAVARNE